MNICTTNAETHFWYMSVYLCNKVNSNSVRFHSCSASFRYGHTKAPCPPDCQCRLAPWKAACIRTDKAITARWFCAPSRLLPDRPVIVQASDCAIRTGHLDVQSVGSLCPVAQRTSCFIWTVWLFAYVKVFWLPGVNCNGLKYLWYRYGLFPVHGHKPESMIFITLCCSGFLLCMF